MTRRKSTTFPADVTRLSLLPPFLRREPGDEATPHVWFCCCFTNYFNSNTPFTTECYTICCSPNRTLNKAGNVSSDEPSCVLSITKLSHGHCIATCTVHLCCTKCLLPDTKTLRSRFGEQSLGPSLVPRPSPAPVFDRLQYMYAYCKRSKTGAGEGLGTRLSRTRFVQSAETNPDPARFSSF